MSVHDDRTLAVVAHAAADFIAREAGTESMITVTRAAPAKDFDHLVVFVTVFPEDKATSALAFLERQREAFSDYLKKTERLGPLPRIDFQPEPNVTDT